MTSARSARPRKERSPAPGERPVYDKKVKRISPGEFQPRDSTGRQCTDNAKSVTDALGLFHCATLFRITTHPHTSPPFACLPCLPCARVPSPWPLPAPERPRPSPEHSMNRPRLMLHESRRSCPACGLSRPELEEFLAGGARAAALAAAVEGVVPRDEPRGKHQHKQREVDGECASSR